MFEEPSSSYQLLLTSNYSKGGDFMERRDNPEPVNPDQGGVLDERQDPTHPLRRGRIKPDALEIAEVIDEAGQQVINPVVFKSVSRMDAGE